VKFTPTAIPDVVMIELDVHKDQRGYFLETYHRKKYTDAGIDANFVQDNSSFSTKGTLRGMHSQRTQQQGKLVRCQKGAIYDVAADVRRGSPTFGQWVAVELTEENARQLWVPEGFVHGFYTLSETAMMEYKCTDLYAPNDELGIVWNDPDLAIEWPVKDPVLSPKDAVYPRFAAVQDKLPEYTK
jgi:dTDP-4-dehydrorhamnose 3,5-epimerase